jgi:single-strand DNA-binding protein
MLPLVIMSGNLVADPEPFFTENGTAGARIRVACNESKKDKDGNWIDGEVVYIKATCWNSMAESVINNAKKGTKVNLTGRLSMDTYTDKAGVERSTPQVTVDSIGAYPYKTKDSITTAVDPWGENQSPF